MGIHITKAGWQTMVMDQGRKFTRSLGIPVSGVIDFFQYWWANGLVGHFEFGNPGPPVLDIRSGQVEIVFDESHHFALTGSPGQYFLDGIRISTHKTHQAGKGQVLRIDSIARNGTVYLAIGGQWKVDYIYGSASADILSPFPGSCGNLLKNDAPLEVNPSVKLFHQKKVSPDYIKPLHHQNELKLRLMAGPELHWIDDHKNALIGEDFAITRTSNRMAYRLETTIEPVFRTSDMVSSIVLPGTIQWPVGGQPILLLPNCQTTGGYPRVARVIDADIWKLAYAGPGDRLRFNWVTREESLYLRQYQLGQFAQVWNETFLHPIKNHWLLY